MAIPLNILPQEVQARVGPSAPLAMRSMVAKALMPMGPEELFLALGYLASNDPGELGRDAGRSLQGMPKAVLQGVLRQRRDPDVLDFAIRTYSNDEELVELLLLNPHSPDTAIEWIARRVSGRLLTIIATNQERIVRHAPLVEAIYYNPEAPMIVVQRVFETAVRHGLALHHLPGYREIYISIFDREPTEEGAEKVEGEVAVDSEELQQQLESTSYTEEGVEDDDFMQILRAAATEEDDAVVESVAEEDDAIARSLYQRVRKMNIAQKVRLALIGNGMARALLIRDPKIVVAMAVLKSPKITDKEVATYAKSKATSDHVVQAICRNREWTRNYRIQLSLLENPKTPPMFTNRWIRNVTQNDLKRLARSRDVPGHVVRMAKNILRQKEQAMMNRGKK